MYVPFIKTTTFSLLLLTVTTFTSAVLVAPSAYAAKKDLTEEILILADRQSADYKNKMAIYLDNVRISQGSILITADIVQISKKFNKEKGVDVKTYLAKGKPAVFKQQLEDGTTISLSADEIKYVPHENLIVVSGNAKVTQAGSHVAASKITYNTLTEKLDAESNPNERVTTILQPTITKAQQNDKN